MKDQRIVHDLALIYAQEKFREFRECISPESRKFPVDINQLADFYHTAVVGLMPLIEETKSAYGYDYQVSTETEG